LAGEAVSRYGLDCILWLSAGCLVCAAFAARLVPPLRPLRMRAEASQFGAGWRVLLRQQAFVRVVIVAALVLGSHAMHDSFVMIRWREAGISSQIASLIWSESVASEVLVFFFVGPAVLRRFGAIAALTLAASAGVLRWAVLASTVQVALLAVVEPLHGLSFALLHLACMRVIAVSVPRELAGTAQALYGLVGIGGATLLLTALSGSLYAHFGPAGFWAMSGLCMGALPAICSLRRYLRTPQIRPNAAAEGCYSNT
jgi:MFS transporter, PPP family, 3-phenylpropionic acid transporter